MSAEDAFVSFVQKIASKKNIVVLAGAGISVSCGIQDFRSRDGLYNTLNYQVSYQSLPAVRPIIHVVTQFMYISVGAWTVRSGRSV